MQAYSVEKVVTKDGKIQLDSLPFLAGETVQIIVLSSNRSSGERAHSSLKGSVIAYTDPLEPVAQEDWDVLA